MKNRVEKRIRSEWRAKVHWCLYFTSNNSRWRAISKARKTYYKVQNRKIKEGLKRIEKMGF